MKPFPSPLLPLLSALFLLTQAPLPHLSIAQERRPIPYPVMPPRAFLQAVENGTRTDTGVPGPSYWMNHAEYRIDAVLSPDDHLLRGEQTVVYYNDSPDTLDQLMVHLRQNLQKGEILRTWPGGETTDGVLIHEVRAQEMILSSRPPNAGPGYGEAGTLMRITPPAAVLPGDSIELGFRWSFRVAEGAPRTGRDESAYFLGYWYPQIAVYDDVEGWVAEQYRGAGEFYMGFADYDVRISVPDGWLVAATGVLRNAEDVLPERILTRLASAEQSDEVVILVGDDERGIGSATRDAPTDTLVWHFSAEHVRDFAFGTSAEYVWHTASARVGDLDGDGLADRALVHVLYRPEKATWDRVAEYGRFTLNFMSDFIMPYPYPHATGLEGPFPLGGIEYPMITLMGSMPWERATFEVVAHEFIHNWWPMIVSSNEKRHMWQDEGPTQYATGAVGRAFFGEDWESFNPDDIYYSRAIHENETEIMRHGDLFPNLEHMLITIYPKMNIAFKALGAFYGRDRVELALREYSLRWAFKHPTPFDFFNTFEDVLETDLDWFWSGWFYETWTLDQSVESVVQEENGVRVTIRDHGLLPMPAPIRVTYADGHIIEDTLDVAHWLQGTREVALSLAPGEVTRVEIDPERSLPDVNRDNNVWPR